MRVLKICAIGAWFLTGIAAQLADQNRPGAGNARAAKIAGQSPRVQSARQILLREGRRIRDPKLRSATLDAIENPNTCVMHRVGVDEARKAAILGQLREQGLLDQAEESGVFPPLLDEGSPCPKLPQPFDAAPGSSFGGHHSYPGGLMLHEGFNELSSQNFAAAYRQIYGPGVFISQDIIIAAPLWHDWAKTLVFQWNSDGTEFHEQEFGGGPGVKTGAHHILGIAEAIKRELPPDFVITLASAHASIASGQEAKVVSWIRTAAILAQIDPVERGYLRRDSSGAWSLALVRHLGADSNILIEYAIHNLSDSDFTLTGPAMKQVELMLRELAPEFGFKTADVAAYNNHFRNVVLSYLSAERLLIIYGNSGIAGVRLEIGKIRGKLDHSTN